MAYQVIAIRDTFKNYVLTTPHLLKTYLQFESQHEEGKKHLQSKVPSFFAEIDKHAQRKGGQVLTWLSDGLHLVLLDENDDSHPTKKAERRRNERMNEINSVGLQRAIDIHTQVQQSRIFVDFGTKAQHLHRFSPGATTELLSVINSELNVARAELLNYRQSLSTKDAQSFDDWKKNGFSDLLEATRFIVGGSHILHKLNPRIKPVSAIKQFLATNPGLTFSVFLMMADLQPCLNEVHSELGANDAVVVFRPLAVDQFPNIPNHDKLQYIAMLRQPGCVAETRVNLSCGMLLTRAARTFNTANDRDMARGLIESRKVKAQDGNGDDVFGTFDFTLTTASEITEFGVTGDDDVSAFDGI